MIRAGDYESEKNEALRPAITQIIVQYSLNQIDYNGLIDAIVTLSNEYDHDQYEE